MNHILHSRMKQEKKLLEEKLIVANHVAIMGHINPDGDCIGSCLALYHYIKNKYPEKQVQVCLTELPEKFAFLKGFEEITTRDFSKIFVNLCIIVDCSDKNRLQERIVVLEQAQDILCIDHHISNDKSIGDTILDADSSSTCELIYELLDKSYIDLSVAECLYTGILHDTCIFKYPTTSIRTMEIITDLMKKGIDFSKIQDKSFYTKTYAQNQVLGRALLESVLFHNKQCVFSYLKKSVMNFYNVNAKDMDGIIDYLRDTAGVEVAIFFYELDTQKYKVSLRSKNIVDVSKIASYFGGGGHIRAAGCIMRGSVHDVVNNLSEQIGLQLD